ncbi:patatin-like phospholipase family protein [Methylocystis sp. WRRC1]|uniref:patatin-like phospholipase family protein n=1 Tax=Methylocystis sp. WRRC1 TaxID=1732014 RepID=UPI001D14CD06|nr:patatin-like phospholipase family protein [Methylocystis sp. WRRC1]MCC3246524.1 patatin-like phospholipase family protein [Methylocystis sp. WRRC1]
MSNEFSPSAKSAGRANGAENPDGPFSLERVICAELAQIESINTTRRKSGLASPLPQKEKPKEPIGPFSAALDSIAVIAKTLGRGVAGEQPSSGEASAEMRDGSASSDAKPPWLAEDFEKKLFDAELTALCLSGGGIRSATFCLGVIQALAKQGLLRKFDYLSTVSGGGYIGSWLSAWASREAGGMKGVEERLNQQGEPPELTGLREFSNYLTPRAGLMSSDTWTGAATVVRNLLINWLLFLPLFLLLVWVPKITVLLLERLHYEFDAGGGVSPWALLMSAAFLYAVAELFTSKQLVSIQAQKRRERLEREQPLARMQSDHVEATPYGAGEVMHFACVIVPIYLAACLTTAVLVYFRDSIAFDDPSTWFWFAAAGANLWAAPFAIAVFISFIRGEWGENLGAQFSSSDCDDGANRHLCELPRMTVSRIFAGAVFGVFLLIAFHIIGEVVGVRDSRYAVVFGVTCCFVAHLAGSILFAATSSKNARLDDLLEWTARSGGWFIVIGLAWTVYATLVLWDPRQDLPGVDMKDWLGEWANGIIASVGGATGLAAALFGHSKSTAATQGDTKSMSAVNWSRVAVAGALLFTVALVFELSRLMDLILLPDSLAKIVAHHRVSDDTVFVFLIAAIVMLIWVTLAAWMINVNKFSLHAYYRYRLMRAYLGASNAERRPNRFTGLDQYDNVMMSELTRVKPLHVVNTALNIVHGDSLALQERKASSYAFTPLTAGNPRLGYRPAERYGDQVSLATAMAISGAAVSPNMGYHSSPFLTFIMTLFNARLGWWLGNPKKSNWEKPGPSLALWPFMMELFGLTNEQQYYVYLSDGGHFENLGVYEMLRRRCCTIVVIDAGCDADLKYEDLGNLVRKARIDLGVEITFDKPQPAATGGDPRRLGLTNRPAALCAAPYCNIGSVQYPDGEGMGALVYIKAAIHGDEPEDIWSYAAAHPDFPHESTGDQFFSESQFESYRRLGYHIGLKVFGGQGEPRSFSIDLEKRASEHCRR